MSDKKKLTNEEIKNQELTDEQANNVTGGASFSATLRVTAAIKISLVPTLSISEARNTALYAMRKIYKDRSNRKDEMQSCDNPIIGGN